MHFVKATVQGLPDEDFETKEVHCVASRTPIATPHGRPNTPQHARLALFFDRASQLNDDTNEVRQTHFWEWRSEDEAEQLMQEMNKKRKRVRAESACRRRVSQLNKRRSLCPCPPLTHDAIPSRRARARSC